MDRGSERSIIIYWEIYLLSTTCLQLILVDVAVSRRFQDFFPEGKGFPTGGSVKIHVQRPPLLVSVYYGSYRRRIAVSSLDWCVPAAYADPRC